MKLIVALSLFLGVQFYGIGQAEVLRLNLKVGATYTHNFKSINNIRHEFNGQTLSTDFDLDYIASFQVLSFTDSVYEMAVKYSNPKILIKQPFTSKDSESKSIKTKASDTVASILSQIENKQFLVTMNTSGKILVVDGLDAIVSIAVNKYTKYSEEIELYKNQIRDSYGSKGFTGNVEMVTHIYANNAVQKGDSWKLVSKLESQLVGKLNANYVLTDIKKDFYLIEGHGVFVLDDIQNTQISGMPTVYNLNSTISSIVKVDRATGWVLDATTNQICSGYIEVKSNPNLPNGLKIPVSGENVGFYKPK